MRIEANNRQNLELILPPVSPSNASRRLRVTYRGFGWAVMVFDFVSIIALSVLSGTAYHYSAFGSTGDVATFVGAGFVAAGLFVACQKAIGLYEPMALIRPNQPLGQVVLLWAFVFTFFATAAFLLKIADNLSRGTMVSWFCVGVIALVGVRAAAPRLFGRALRTGTLRAQRVVAICDAEEVADPDLARLLRQVGYQVGQYFVLEDASDRHDGSVSRDFVKDVEQCARTQEISEILVCVNWRDKRRLDSLVEALHIVPLPVRLVPDRQLRPFLAESFLRIGPTFGIEVQRAPLTHTERALKRALDVAVASAGLAMLAPMFLIIALAIKLDSRGPVLFRQLRTGFNGRIFSIYKFRTMTTMEDGAEVRQATRLDPRVTGVGRWLRRTSIDELPQLLNVLAGHMSLVGPRPHALAHDNYYSQLIAGYAMRHHVKPGITGWAQVNGFRGETSEINLMQRRVEHDVWYIGNWSFVLDIKIILRTCLHVVNARDVY